MASVLVAAPLRRPIHEAFHIVAVLPGKVEKLAGRQVGGLFAQESLKAPTNVRTLPRVKPVAPRCVPVIVKCLEHFLRNGRNSPSPFRQDTSSQFAPRLSQLPVYRRSISAVLPSFDFSVKCIGTVVQAIIPRRVTFRSLPAVSLMLSAVSRNSFWTPS